MTHHEIISAATLATAGAAEEALTANRRTQLPTQYRALQEAEHPAAMPLTIGHANGEEHKPRGSWSSHVSLPVRDAGDRPLRISFLSDESRRLAAACGLQRNPRRANACFRSTRGDA